MCLLCLFKPPPSHSCQTPSQVLLEVYWKECCYFFPHCQKISTTPKIWDVIATTAAIVTEVEHFPTFLCCVVTSICTSLKFYGTNLVAVDEGRVLLPHHTSSIIKEWMNVEPIRQSTVYCCHVLFSFDWLKQYLRLHVINSRWYHDFYVFLCIITSLTTRHVFIIRLISFIFLYIKCFCFLGGGVWVFGLITFIFNWNFIINRTELKNNVCLFFCFFSGRRRTPQLKISPVRFLYLSH